jgi:cation transporter-like permease
MTAPIRSSIPTREERAATLMAQEREASRIVRRTYFLVIAVCFFWMAAGLVLMWWAFHTGDEHLGRIAFLSGILVTDVGVLGTLVYAYNRAERDGWI